MEKTHKTTGSILLLVAIWMTLANFVSWKATFLASSDKGSLALVRLFDRASGDALSKLYLSRSGLKKADVIHRLAISNHGALLTIPLDMTSVLAHVDSMSAVSDGLLVSGWTFVPSEIETAQFVVAVLGESIVGVGEVGASRADVAAALGEGRAVFSGFSFSIPGMSESRKCDLKMLALTQSMHLYQIPFRCEATAPG